MKSIRNVINPCFEFTFSDFCINQWLKLYDYFKRNFCKFCYVISFAKRKKSVESINVLCELRPSLAMHKQYARIRIWKKFTLSIGESCLHLDWLKIVIKVHVSKCSKHDFKANEWKARKLMNKMWYCIRINYKLTNNKLSSIIYPKWSNYSKTLRKSINTPPKRRKICKFKYLPFK